MALFGREDEAGRSLGELLAVIPDPIEKKALVQYVPPRAGSRPHWGLILLAARALWIVHGDPADVLGRLLRPGSTSQHLLSLSYEEIREVDIPARGGVLTRLVRGPTRRVRIHTSAGELIELEADDVAIRVLESARRRAGLAD